MQEPGGGAFTPAAEVVESLQRDTVSFSVHISCPALPHLGTSSLPDTSEVWAPLQVSFSCGCGRGGSQFSPGLYANVVFFSLKAEAARADAAVGWLRKLLFCTVLDPNPPVPPLFRLSHSPTSRARRL